MSDGNQIVLLVSVGNTRTRVAAMRDGALEPSRVIPNSDRAELVRSVSEEVRSAGAQQVLIASVNGPVSGILEESLAPVVTVLRIGRDIWVPIANTLEDPSTVGQDRLLNALGAFARSEQACIVIDAGTAVTVDFVDGFGTFHGGAIAPGLVMMRDALHEKTAALPLAPLTPASSAPTPFGKDTIGAINVGVRSMVVGLVHLLIDKYAEFYEAYPRVIATGGDAAVLFEDDELVEHIVPDLTLIGMKTAWEMSAAEQETVDLDSEAGDTR
jgi:type III pantothenate kinase